MRDKLRLVFCNYGLGKYYIFTSEGIKYPFIQMNIKMYKYDKELFFWVLAHELDHYIFFQERDNEGKKDVKNEIKQAWPSNKNRKMLVRQFKFELKEKGKVFNRGFAILENKKLMYEPQIICYHKCDKLDPEQEKEIIDFVGKVNDL